MARLPDPHDRYFREVLSRREAAASFLQNYLPPEIVSGFDLSSLELSKDTFVDRQLRRHFADLLYTVKLQGSGSAHVYLLFEHKSAPDPRTPLQLLRYMERIWSQAVDQKRPLWPIIPIVFYQGSASWSPELRFRYMLDLPVLPDLERFLPDYEYLLCDVSHLSDAEIKGEVYLRAFMLAMKYVRRADLDQGLAVLQRILSELAGRRTGLEWIETLFRYLASADERIGEPEITRLVEAATVEGENIMPTLAEKWIEQGIEKGRYSGLLEGLEVATELKYGRVVCQTLMPELRKIKDRQVLKRLMEKLLTAATVEEFRSAIPGEAPD